MTSAQYDALLAAIVSVDEKVNGMLAAIVAIETQVQPAYEAISSNPLFSMLLGKKKTHE